MRQQLVVNGYSMNAAIAAEAAIAPLRMDGLFGWLTQRFAQQASSREWLRHVFAYCPAP